MKKIFIAILPLILLSCHPIPASCATFTGATCSVSFSPKGDATDNLVAAINGAKKSIHVMAYSFTSEPIAAALSAAAERKVEVIVIADKSQLTANSSKIDNVKVSGAEVYIDSKHAIAHNKVMIFDGTSFHTGSFNFTTAAENSNAENSLICKSKAGAAIYEENFKLHLSHSTKY